MVSRTARPTQCVTEGAIVAGAMPETSPRTSVESRFIADN